MRPTLHPRLVNGPFDDPVLYISFLFQNRAILFDLGDIQVLPARDILKITDVFVTHTHMDHFTGFDRLLRLFIGRQHTLRLYGPEGFLKNVEGKLAGYTWNLVDNHSENLVLEVTEVRASQRITRRYSSRHRFQAGGDAETAASDAVLREEPAWRVSALTLDHGIPCLGFAIEERFHVNIRSDALTALGLLPGPWLQEFKQALYRQRAPDTPIEALTADGTRFETHPLGRLLEAIALITPGQKVAYITDALFRPSGLPALIAFVNDADQLYIEAAFLAADGETARTKRHLTAAQAGMIAALARVKQFTPFHFSPRYTGMGERVESEAREAHARWSEPGASDRALEGLGDVGGDEGGAVHIPPARPLPKGGP